jgi:membrane protein DedA with SNARE-associated domain
MVPALAFLEACPGIGLFVSGVILLSVSTVLYTEHLLTLPQILSLAFLGALMSDHLGFYAGRWFGGELRKTKIAIRHQSKINKSEAFILKYGALSVVAGRLMTAIRSLIPMTVGASGTDRLTFTLADIAACFIWTAGLGLLVVGLNNVFS